MTARSLAERFRVKPQRRHGGAKAFEHILYLFGSIMQSFDRQQKAARDLKKWLEGARSPLASDFGLTLTRSLTTLLCAAFSRGHLGVGLSRRRRGGAECLRLRDDERIGGNGSHQCIHRRNGVLQSGGEFTRQIAPSSCENGVGSRPKPSPTEVE